MLIRQAVLTDAETIATCLLLAMEDIVYQFIGLRNYSVAKKLLLHFVQQGGNQYSYQNCWVAQKHDKVIAAVNIYDGAHLIELRQPVEDFIKANFNPKYNPENETELGELYIDSIGVLPEYQNMGIGSILLAFLKEKYVDQNGQTLGLLVEADNVCAKQLYLKMGFRAVGIKTLMGKPMEHLQLKPPTLGLSC